MLRISLTNAEDIMAEWCRQKGYLFVFLSRRELDENGEYRKFLKEQHHASRFLGL